MILAECCGTMRLSVTKNPNLSERVCKPCSGKIRNAAELYRFVEEAISATEDVSSENRNKRLLPTTITSERERSKSLKSEAMNGKLLLERFEEILVFPSKR